MAQSSQDVVQRIDRLERELTTLNAATYRDGKTPVAAAPASNTAMADIQSRLDSMETQMRDMTGKIEEAQHKAQQAEDALARYKTDAEMRLKVLEDKALNVPDRAATNTPDPAAQNATDTTKPFNPPPTETGDINAPAPADSPTSKTLGSVTSDAKLQDAATVYEDAYALLKQGNHARAQSGFQNFLKAYPDHPLAANASYWHAETYYAKNDFKTASRLFAESYKKYPKGPKAADSVLKLGLSLAGEGKNQDACIALKQLGTAFKNAEAAVQRRAAQEKTKLGCA
ncbi:MAG: tol-pal system protein YbgF [Pseudomonadota bacterium]